MILYENQLCYFVFNYFVILEIINQKFIKKLNNRNNQIQKTHLKLLKKVKHIIIHNYQILGFKHVS